MRSIEWSLQVPFPMFLSDPLPKSQSYDILQRQINNHWTGSSHWTELTVLIGLFFKAHFPLKSSV